MSNEKPVELTEAERDRLLHAHSVGPMGVIHVASRIVAAREAAARREALQEAERLQTLLNSMDHFAEVAERCEAKSNEYAAKIARVKALADAAEATAVGPPFVFTRDLRAALADPERDKESGR